MPSGLLRARCALVFNTSNTPPERETTAFDDPLERVWRDCVFGLCGVDNVVRRVYGPVAASSETSRATWLADVAEQVRATA